MVLFSYCLAFFLDFVRWSGKEIMHSGVPELLLNLQKGDHEADPQDLEVEDESETGGETELK